MPTDIRQLLSSNVYNALIGAAAPSSANVFATMADITAMSVWKLAGNTTGAIDKMGSLDNFDVSLIANNAVVATLRSSGNFNIVKFINDALDTSAFDVQSRILYDTGPGISINLDTHTLYDIAGKVSLNYQLRSLVDSTGTTTVATWSTTGILMNKPLTLNANAVSALQAVPLQQLTSTGLNYWNVAGNTTGAIKKVGSLDNFIVNLVANNVICAQLYPAGNLSVTNFITDSTAVNTFDVTNRVLYDLAPVVSIDLQNRSLQDGSNIAAVGYSSRILANSAGTGVLFWSTNGVGIGAACPSGFTGYVQGNYRQQTPGGSLEDSTGNKISTTDATPSTLHTIAIPTNTVVLITARISYRKSSGAGAGVVNQGTSFSLTTSVQNISGTLTIDRVQNDYAGTINAIAGVTATLVVSGTNIIVQVTGVVNDTIIWTVTTKTNPA